MMFEIVALGALVAILHKFALMYHLYYVTDWADIIMHFLGGLLLGMITLFVFFVSGWIDVPHNRRVVILVTIGSVWIIGLSWELWEIWAQLIDALRDKLDSLSDLVFDTLGGIVALVYYYKYLWKKESRD